VAVLASELCFALLIVGGTQAVRRGLSMWAAVPAVMVVDLRLTWDLAPHRPTWVWFANVIVLSLALQSAGIVAAVEAMRDLPDDPPPAPPTPALRELAAGLRTAGFAPIAEHAVLIGDPEMHLWVLLREDGTLSELVHREPRAPGFAFRTDLDPPGPGYDTVESVPWTRGWPGPTTRRIEIADASWPDLLAAHDEALAEVVAHGARPVAIPREEALANVLDSDRAAARRMSAHPWRMAAQAYRRLLPSRRAPAQGRT
jgi:hypothetical protein